MLVLAGAIGVSGSRRAAARLVMAAVCFGTLAVQGELAHAEPLVPTDDNEIIEVLPVAAGSHAEDRRWRRLAASRPGDVHLAVMIARRELDAARTTGDPRFAGQALAALDRWPTSDGAPSDVLLARATVLQFLHDFDGAAGLLRQLLARPTVPPQVQAQAFLTLATILRVQGRYVDSDAACQGVVRSGAEAYGQACLAENVGLRGQFDAAYRALDALLADPDLTAASRAWMLTTRAELAQRDARIAEADEAFRASLATSPDAYAAVAYADFLIDQGRPRDALVALAPFPRTDAVLLRTALAESAAGMQDAARDVTEMRTRFEAERARPSASPLHAREEAMFALSIDRTPYLAVRLAAADVSRQREPVDLLVYARAAAAGGDKTALAQARQLASVVGLRDRRIDAIH